MISDCDDERVYASVSCGIQILADDFAMSRVTFCQRCTACVQCGFHQLR